MSLAILDVDGTLVDTNYQHALAWFRALRDNGIVIPIWRIHRHIGMGGDQMVGSLAGERAERERGDAIRDSESRHYGRMIEEVQPMRDARELIQALHERGHTVVLASSAKQEELDHYLDLLDARELADGWTSSADVEATKPHPDLIRAALDRAGAAPEDAVMIGDSIWDAQAAEAAGVRMIAVMTGGFSRGELAQAGAVSVYESVSELGESLSETPLG